MHSARFVGKRDGKGGRDSGNLGGSSRSSRARLPLQAKSRARRHRSRSLSRPARSSSAAAIGARPRSSASAISGRGAQIDYLSLAGGDEAVAEQWRKSDAAREVKLRAKGLGKSTQRLVRRALRIRGQLQSSEAAQFTLSRFAKSSAKKRARLNPKKRASRRRLLRGGSMASMPALPKQDPPFKARPSVPRCEQDPPFKARPSVPRCVVPSKAPAVSQTSLGQRGHKG